MLDKTETFEKKLIIVACGSFEKEILQENADILAFTISSMAQLDRYGIEYLSLSDFIKRDDATTDTNLFMYDFRRFISEIDRILEKKGVQHAFLSSAFWILVRLSNMRFISIIIDKINQLYSNVTIVGSYSDITLGEPTIDWKSINWSGFGTDLGFQLAQLKHGINNVVYSQSCVKRNLELKYTIVKIKSIALRLHELIYRRFSLWIKSKQHFFHSSNRCVWVQGGYDVDILKYECKDTRFKEINSINELISLNHEEGIDYSSIQGSLDSVINGFLQKCFPYHKTFVYKMFWSYLNQIVAFYPVMMNIVRKKIINDSPKAVLYSIGAQNILEEAVAVVAEQYSIPVFFFKHSSVDNMFVIPSVFDPYFEKNPYLKRTQFLASSLEVKEYSGMNNIKCVTVGALSRPKTFLVDKNNRKILYSVGPPNYHTFKDMGRILHDKERYDFAKSLVQLSKNLELDLDIKIHPAQAIESYELFQHLLDDDHDNNVRLIVEGSIERLVQKYGLIILDMVSTRVLSSILYLKIPIVMYIPHGFPVNKEYFDELKSRVYIVRTNEELTDIVSNFRLSGLKDLSNEGFNNRFLGASDCSVAINIVKREVYS
jgi:hypothetical protein